MRGEVGLDCVGGKASSSLKPLLTDELTTGVRASAPRPMPGSTVWMARAARLFLQGSLGRNLAEERDNQDTLSFWRDRAGAPSLAESGGSPGCGGTGIVRVGTVRSIASRG